MDLRQVRKLANELMTQHVGSDYYFCWTNKKKQAAGALVTPGGDNILYFSKLVARHNPIDVIKDILLHEVAHFLTWNKQDDDHGSLWKETFLGLGGSGKIKYKVPVHGC